MGLPVDEATGPVKTSPP